MFTFNADFNTIIPNDLKEYLKEHNMKPVALALMVEPEEVECNVHEVKPGETVGRIANQHNVTVADIVRLNNLKNPNVIRVGQILKIKE